MEVMLADGGSTDDTQRVIARWRHRLTWWRSAPDQGQAASINEAIERGRAPFVCWMNSDDLFLSEGLAALVQALEADPGTAVVYGGCRLIDENGHLIGLHRSGEVSVQSLSRRCVVPQPASLIRRDTWNRIGGLKESLNFSLDYDLWWRLYHSGSRFTRIGVDVAAARFHPHAKSFTKAREMYAEAKSVVHHHYGSLPMSWRLREPFSIGAREQSTVPASLVRTYRFWSMRIRQAAKLADAQRSSCPRLGIGSQSEVLKSIRVEPDHWPKSVERCR